MKKVLIITYYWPPSGGAGVQRWLKFVKYLRNFGWEPIIYTVENGEFPIIDESLGKDVPEGIEVIREPIWEPYNLYKGFIGHKKEDKIANGFLTEKSKPKRLDAISVWVRGNFFIPDARMFWIKPSIKRLKKYLSDNKVDAIVSNGPPHTTHMIGLGVKKATGLPWLADFRDPWTQIDFYQKLKLSKWADAKHKRLEKKVLKSADCLVTVSNNTAKDFLEIGNFQFNVVNNGFDEDDFTVDAKLSDDFTIKHIGSFNSDRNPMVLWKVLGELTRENAQMKTDLKIELIGAVDISVTQSLEENDLKTNVEYKGQIPHSEVTRELKESQVLLLPINDAPNALAIAPGKLYEYLASRRPILLVGPVEGDAAKIVDTAKAGYACGFDAYDEMRSAIEEMYAKYKSGKLQVEGEGIDQYSRRNLTEKIAKLLDNIIA